MFASRRGRRLTPVVEWLLKNQVDTAQKDSDGNTAWDMTFAQGDAVTMGIFAVQRMTTELKGAWLRWRRQDADPRGVAVWPEHRCSDPLVLGVRDFFVLQMNDASLQIICLPFDSELSAT